MALLEKDVEVKTSTIPGAGKGLFALNFIPRNSRIVEYKGKVRTWDEARLDASNGYIYFLKPNYVIDARDFPKTLARYANDAKGLVHSKGRDNNARFEAQGLRVFLVSARDIEPGEEILVAYGKGYWDTVRNNKRLDEW